VRKRDGTLTIVTGASSNHYRCLGHLLRSLDYHETAPVIVYDLGLTAEEAAALRAAGRRGVRFQFERYPSFFGTEARRRQPCCWKPALIREVLETTDSAVLWMDAGNLVHERLDRERQVLATTGFYSPHSVGDLARFTHPQVLELLDARPEILTDLNRNGAIVGFGRNEAGLELSRAWRDCALREEIMSPPGWTKDRWRSDQAILSVLAAQFRRRYGFELADEKFAISIQNDKLTAAQARRRMKRPLWLTAAAAAVKEAQQRRQPMRRLWRAVKRSWRSIKAVAPGG